MKIKWLIVCVLAIVAFCLAKKNLVKTHPPHMLSWNAEKLSSLPNKQLEQMLLAGKEIQNQPNVVKELLSTGRTFYEYDHFPEENVIDENNASEYFYHAHRKSEHGHFHVFVRDGKKQSHLIGISIDEKGQPKSLFTVNQWVTGDLWKTAKELSSHLHGFQIDLPESSWLANQWLSGMICLFSPQIADLLEERDRLLTESANENFLKDRSREILTEMEISINLQTETILNILMSELVVLNISSSRIQAETLKSALDEAGIFCILQPEDAGGMMPHLAQVQGMRLLVRSEDKKKAEEILSSFSNDTQK
ncbi:MAG: hypothetical protein K1000chlam3_00450 [Chlamydiae bacterium]|nr:hypothetical protein [Chlamydiota bacterium]